ncbi:MAG TPA: hypothetical protein VE224_19780 [Pseudolabrys sp.]|nr:hypothetical protein [Pseudolabrys sp.]
MADYEPLIARAVAGLEQSTGENRRALYERARSALVAQLRGVDPPLDEGEITRERMALEEAIRKVEADAAAKERVVSPKAKPEPAPEPTPQPAPPPPKAPPAARPAVSLGDRGLRSFRESMAEAEGLGDATAGANRAARQTYGTVSGEAAPAQEARKESRGDEAARKETHFFEPPDEPGPAPAFLGEPDEGEEPGAHADEHGHGDDKTGHDDHFVPPFHDEDAEAGYKPPPRSYGRLIALLAVILVVLGLGAAVYWQRATIGSMMAGLHGSSSTQVANQQPAKPAVQPKIADRIGPSSSTPAATPNAGGTQQAANASAQPEQPAAAPAATVAQKVVLYEEDPNNPQGKRYVGSAIWRTDTVSPGSGLAPELAVRADVEIPERHMHMTWSLRRNTDKALPASHTIEITFTVPADFDEGGIGNVPGVLMKNAEQARGIPLTGQSVKVTNGYFLIGLSSVDVAKQRNIDLLKTRDWFDIPIVYTSGKRAILAMEKGAPGDRVFKEAFRAWGE